MTVSPFTPCGLPHILILSLATWCGYTRAHTEFYLVRGVCVEFFSEHEELFKKSLVGPPELARCASLSPRFNRGVGALPISQS